MTSIGIKQAKAMLERLQAADAAAVAAPHIRELADFYPVRELPPLDPYANLPPEVDVRLKTNRPPRGSRAERDLVEATFACYREHGFPFHTWTHERLRTNAAHVRQADVLTGHTLVRSHVGVAVVSAFHTNMWRVKGAGKRSAMEAYEDDDVFRRAVTSQVRTGSQYLRAASIRSAIQLRGGCTVVSNFRPAVAKALYEHFGAELVVDFCAGWGGRLFGALCSDTAYVGIDPHTKAIENNRRFLEQYRVNHPNQSVSADLVWGCAEDVLGQRIWRPDLILTSPPYFDTEVYSQEVTQSCIRYPRLDRWLEGFLQPCIRGSYYDLQRKGHLVLNVNPVMVADTIRLAVAAGFSVKAPFEMQMSSKLAKRSFRAEPVLVFQKP